MRLHIALLVGRVVRVLAKLRGGGSAIPGRIALLIEPNFLEKTLGRMRQGIIFVSGSNGKSTTTSMLSGVLREHGLSVLTNPAGGNLPQGLVSALIPALSWNARITQDIAVLEVDEAYGKMIADRVAPNKILITNIQVDQLNRFHSPDEVFEMLLKLCGTAKDSILVNGSDTKSRQLGSALAGLGKNVSDVKASGKAISSAAHGLVGVTEKASQTSIKLQTRSELLETSGKQATVKVASEEFNIQLPSRGLHYAIDATLAIGMASEILGKTFSLKKTAAAFKDLEAVYGRGEVIEHEGQQVEIVMMKNPPSLQANLDAWPGSPERLWISVDEGTPDPSWIYGIDIQNIKRVDVLSGTKAYQWATMLAYRGVEIDLIEPDEDKALKVFLALPSRSKTKTALVNYEQMMLLRKNLGYLNLDGDELA